MSASSSLFSIDAVRFPEEIADARSVLLDYLDGGGTLALGLIPVLPGEGEEPSPLSRLRAIEAELGRELDDRLVLSATCGTMLAPPAREREIAAELAETAEFIDY